MIPTIQRTACVVCHGKNLEEVFALPRLPLTGLYVPKAESTRQDLCADTGLLFCFDCGQGQLSKNIDPALQYGDQYWFRSSTSHTARAGIDFFKKFFESKTRGRKFQSLLEVGCNDLYLLKNIRARAEHCVGIDPIWAGKEFSEENLTVRSKLEGSEKPDLIISEHTFEHLVNPSALFSTLVECASDNALFFIEIPSFEYLVEHGRFDQVFHQHLNYFSLRSFRHQIQTLGCRYLDHTYNPSYWGSLIVVFQKTSPQESLFSEQLHFSQIRRRYGEFLSSMARLRKAVDSAPTPVYGYGAAQIAPMLAYHLKTDFKELVAFLDDDERKWGLKFANLKPEIQSVESVSDLRNKTLLLTALDYAPLLVPKLQKLTSNSLRLDLLGT